MGQDFALLELPHFTLIVKFDMCSFRRTSVGADMARSLSQWVGEKGLPWCIFWPSVGVSCGSGAPSQGARFVDCALGVFVG